ncbi:hypothetical protein HYH02_008003 [Chlamydomonas schloesseri]|uniref:Uncharacterized protein n=1 Tax=Chlamydomonas schloesseri TaxID=2026947 RepID=A0A835WG88_9CHLO|nr:hypothetical protein HYH02_008003 [Chlamydomonas schloesseri]|eukprot:KAG2446846.1 hypothetical protein HYH02_008003 [Chlamydomonas schloesseri]
MAHLVPGSKRRVAPAHADIEPDIDKPRVTGFGVAIPPASILNDLPEPMQRRLLAACVTGSPTLKEIYGAKPVYFVVAAIRHGPSILAANLSQNITNKAVISALLLTFNYPALFAAAEQQADVQGRRQIGSLFHAYFFFQMTAVICAFAVMLSAAIFVSHVLRTGQQLDSIINYLKEAMWVDNAFNEYTFIVQCLFTAVAVVLYVCLNYPSALAWVLAGMAGLMVACLLTLFYWSIRVYHRQGQREWEELVAAEVELRRLAAAAGVGVSGLGTGGLDAKGGSVPQAFAKTRDAAGIASEDNED